MPSPMASLSDIVMTCYQERKQAGLPDKHILASAPCGCVVGVHKGYTEDGFKQGYAVFCGWHIGQGQGQGQEEEDTDG